MSTEATVKVDEMPQRTSAGETETAADDTIMTAPQNIGDEDRIEGGAVPSSPAPTLAPEPSSTDSSVKNGDVNALEETDVSEKKRKAHRTDVANEMKTIMETVLENITDTRTDLKQLRSGIESLEDRVSGLEQAKGNNLNLSDELAQKLNHMKEHAELLEARIAQREAMEAKLLDSQDALQEKMNLERSRVNCESDLPETSEANDVEDSSSSSAAEEQDHHAAEVMHDIGERLRQESARRRSRRDSLREGHLKAATSAPLPKSPVPVAVVKSLPVKRDRENPQEDSSEHVEEMLENKETSTFSPRKVAASNPLPLSPAPTMKQSPNKRPKTPVVVPDVEQEEEMPGEGKASIGEEGSSSLHSEEEENALPESEPTPQSPSLVGGLMKLAASVPLPFSPFGSPTVQQKVKAVPLVEEPPLDMGDDKGDQQGSEPSDSSAQNGDESMGERDNSSVQEKESGDQKAQDEGEHGELMDVSPDAPSKASSVEVSNKDQAALTVPQDSENEEKDVHQAAPETPADDSGVDESFDTAAEESSSDDSGAKESSSSSSGVEEGSREEEEEVLPRSGSALDIAGSHFQEQMASSEGNDPPAVEESSTAVDETNPRSLELASSTPLPVSPSPVKATATPVPSVLQTARSVPLPFSPQPGKTSADMDVETVPVVDLEAEADRADSSVVDATEKEDHDDSSLAGPRNSSDDDSEKASGDDMDEVSQVDIAAPAEVEAIPDGPEDKDEPSEHSMVDPASTADEAVEETESTTNLWNQSLREMTQKQPETIDESDLKVDGGSIHKEQSEPKDLRAEQTKLEVSCDMTESDEEDPIQEKQQIGDDLSDEREIVRGPSVQDAEAADRSGAELVSPDPEEVFDANSPSTDKLKHASNSSIEEAKMNRTMETEVTIDTASSHSDGEPHVALLAPTPEKLGKELKPASPASATSSKTSRSTKRSRVSAKLKEKNLRLSNEVEFLREKIKSVHATLTQLEYGLPQPGTADPLAPVQEEVPVHAGGLAEKDEHVEKIVSFSSDAKQDEEDTLGSGATKEETISDAVSVDEKDSTEDEKSRQSRIRRIALLCIATIFAFSIYVASDSITNILGGFLKAAPAVPDFDNARSDVPSVHKIDMYDQDSEGDPPEIESETEDEIEKEPGEQEEIAVEQKHVASDIDSGIKEDVLVEEEETGTDEPLSVEVEAEVDLTESVSVPDDSPKHGRLNYIAGASIKAEPLSVEVEAEVDLTESVSVPDDSPKHGRLNYIAGASIKKSFNKDKDNGKDKKPGPVKRVLSSVFQPSAHTRPADIFAQETYEGKGQQQIKNMIMLSHL